MKQLKIALVLFVVFATIFVACTPMCPDAGGVQVQCSSSASGIPTYFEPTQIGLVLTPGMVTPGVYDPYATMTSVPSFTPMPTENGGFSPVFTPQAELTATPIWNGGFNVLADKAEPTSASAKESTLPDGWEECEITDSNGNTITVIYPAGDDCAGLPLSLLFAEHAGELMFIPPILSTNRVVYEYVDVNGQVIGIKFVDFDREVLPLLTQMAQQCNGSIQYAKLAPPDPSTPMYSLYYCREIDVVYQSNVTFGANNALLEAVKILTEYGFDLSYDKFLIFGSAATVAGNGSDIDIAMRHEVVPGSSSISDMYRVLTLPENQLRIALATGFLDSTALKKIEHVAFMIIPYVDSQAQVPLKFDIPLESSKINAPINVPANVPLQPLQ